MMIYLDNAATTQVSQEVLDTMLPFFREQYGNAGTLYKLGRQAADAVHVAREQVANLFHTTPEHIVFTSGGSEGNSMVIKGVSEQLRQRGKTHIILSAIEHDSVIKAVESLTKHQFDATYVLPRPDGTIAPSDVAAAIRDDTGLVCVMFANNEIGSVNNIKEIGRVCQSRSILFHVDCVQAAGQYDIDVDELHIDFATISAHKIHGPKGIGAAYARDLHFSPLILGGIAQEFGLRGGTENVPGIVGLGAACMDAQAAMQDVAQHMLMLKNTFLESLLVTLHSPTLADSDVHLNGAGLSYTGKIMNLRINGISGESLVLMLDGQDVCISAGSACRSHESAPSHVLLALGLSPDDARSSIRISFSKYNTYEEAKRSAELMAHCITTLRKLGGTV